VTSDNPPMILTAGKGGPALEHFSNQADRTGSRDAACIVRMTFTAATRQRNTLRWTHGVRRGVSLTVLSHQVEQYSLPRPDFAPPVRYGTLTLETRWLLSPLAGFTNLPFRRIVRSLGGVGLATTDLVNARGLLAGSEKTHQLIETCDDDQPFAVQIFGADAAIMCDAAQFLETRGVDSIDINMGCPVDRITKTGSGAGMMCRTDKTVRLVERVVESVGIPVTVKMRLGWDTNRITAPRFAAMFEDAGVTAIAIHGRTREQGFSGKVDSMGIGQVVHAVRRIPVVGNGDVRSVSDADRMIRETGCHAVSIGRGALANPWIFRQLEEWEQSGFWSPAGSFDDRLELLNRQFLFLQQRHGSARAIILFRRMGHWYLKGMCVRKKLRGRFQSARTREEFDCILRIIADEGPVTGSRTGVLRAVNVPVPSGPVERW